MFFKTDDDKQEKIAEAMLAPFNTSADQISATQNYFAAASKYMNDFMVPLMLSSNYITNADSTKIFRENPKTLCKHIWT